MADNLPTPPKPGGVGVLKEKWGPLPAWVWLAIGIAVLAFYIYKRRGGATGSSNLGSPTQLPNLFQTAGPMPFTGGGTTVSVTTNVAEENHKKKHKKEKHPKSKIHRKHRKEHKPPRHHREHKPPRHHRRHHPRVQPGGTMIGGPQPFGSGGAALHAGQPTPLGGLNNQQVNNILRGLGLLPRHPRPRTNVSHPQPFANFPIVKPTHHRQVTVSAPKRHTMPPQRKLPPRPVTGVVSRY